MKPSSYRWLYLVAGISLRLGLLAFGRYQDTHSALLYTDVDYFVFSDAAKAILHGCPLPVSPLSETDWERSDRSGCAQGFIPATARFLLFNDPALQSPDDGSGFKDDSLLFLLASRCYDVARPVFTFLARLGDPYSRPTYRYTPFLALGLTPIHLLACNDFGKYLFAIADVLCAVLMWLILDGRRAPASAPDVHVHLPGLLWLLNPIPAQISTRGSSEGLVGLVVLLFLYLLLLANPEAPLGLTPVHAPSSAKPNPPADGPSDSTPVDDAIATYRPLVPESALPLLDWSNAALLSPVMLGLAVHLKIFPVIYGIPVLAHLSQSTMAAYDPVMRRRLGLWTRHAAGIKYGTIAFTTFMTTNAIAWLLWGSPFIEHTFTYHLTRQDHRHNFSPYFLPTYLSGVADLSSPPASPAPSFAARVLASPLFSFGPQALLVGALGWNLGRRDVVAAATAQTLAFVAFNKVCTSQYFLWFLWLVPLVWPSLAITTTRAALLVGLWIGAQALWLSQAFLLEFRAEDVFARVWASSLVLLGVHAALLAGFVKGWADHRVDVARRVKDGAARAKKDR